jgi:hypothetical protein
MLSQPRQSIAKNEGLSLAERFLLFEEPKTKWLRLNRLLKQKPGISDRLKLNLGNSDDNVQRLLSVLFAAEEAQRFESKAFEGIASSLTNSELAEHLTESEVTYWSQTTGLDLDKSLWLAIAYHVIPEWHRLDRLQDGRFELIETCLEWLHKDPSSIRLLGLSQKQFRKAFTTEHWLVLLKQLRTIIDGRRASLPANVLPKMLVLVEGPTDNLLLPCFAKNAGVDLNTFSIMFISAGGAKQIARRYGLLKEMVSIPIFCVFDGDAQTESDKVRNNLRSSDCLHVLADGEIEDVLNLDSFVNHLNNYFSSLTNTSYYQTISPVDFDGVSGRGERLERFWRDRKLGHFDKLHFARFLADALGSEDEISLDGKTLIASLVRLRNLSK